MRNKNVKYLWLMAFGLMLIFNLSTQMGSTHSPKFIDLKYYFNDGVLSVYYTHGVSNTSYHYVDLVEFKFFNLTDEWMNTGNDGEPWTEEDKIEQPDVTDEDIILIANFNVTYDKQEDDSLDTQDTQIFHHNYTIADYNASLEIQYWTYIRVTAHCNLGGSFTNDIIAGHLWWDEPHSFLEALVPTAICTLVVLAPIIIWAIIGKQKEKRKNNQEVQE
ncbi:MAG: hypothetical protein JW776_12885 [Candidatus Lokiarchaeota archaeon]|nr:hypothetical protein [Candidatus Lokiarchaeota archaeon]